jgi:hypothetical protein
MCDYSLMAIPNRLAVSGEELVIHRFDRARLLGWRLPAIFEKDKSTAGPKPRVLAEAQGVF